ncbi:MAG: glycosyltransferase family 8 protein, partial [Synergistaceae bacterium]|nr:glycosyltransferase family 8 protein [Synergistaceae bacterium]
LAKFSIHERRDSRMQDKASINDPIHVALAVYDPSGTYSQHAGVTITSIFENTKSKVIIHLLHDDTLTEDNRKKFIRTAEKYNQTIELHDVTIYRQSLTQKIKDLTIHFTVGTLYRLFIPEIFSELDKIIYLDCDIVVNLDISELWNINLENNCFAGCLDEDIIRMSIFSHINLIFLLNGCKLHLYINAGVLVMNLTRIRAFMNMPEMFKEWIDYHTYSMTTTDQDFINSVFIDSIKRIDGRFNRQLWTESDVLSNSVIHFNKRKPWKNFPSMYADFLYWKIYLHSAWGENVTPEDMIIILKRIQDNSDPMQLISSKQCVLRIAEVIRKKIPFQTTGMRIKMFFMDCFHKMKYKLKALKHKQV